MSLELHVQFRLPPQYARKLKALAELHGTTPNLIARILLIDTLEGSWRQEFKEQLSAVEASLAALSAEQQQQGEEFSQFHDEFRAALKRAVDRRG